MPLQPGTTLGAYSVTAKTGEGGTGKVYRARDTKFDRDVAYLFRNIPTTDVPIKWFQRSRASICPARLSS